MKGPWIADLFSKLGESCSIQRCCPQIETYYITVVSFVAKEYDKSLALLLNVAQTVNEPRKSSKWNDSKNIVH